MRARRLITVVGCHAAGEIGDVITGGVLPPPGSTMLEKKLNMERDFDHVRKLLLCEPRGSVARHVNLIVPATRPDCVAGAIVMEPTEYPPMSGSNTICIATVLLETGIVGMTEPETVFSLDMPGGAVRVRAACRDGVVESIEFENVPAFVHALDVPLEVEGVGGLRVDIAYGGMFYALVDASALGLALEAGEAREIAVLGEAIRRAVREQIDVVHPEHPEIRGVSIVQIARVADARRRVTRSAVVVSPGRLDRSPTGTALSARLAMLHERGELAVGESMIQESVLGTRFEGRIVSTTTVGHRRGIVPAIRGSAFVTGLHQYLVDPRDPFPEGYCLPDTWGLGARTKQ